MNESQQMYLAIIATFIFLPWYGFQVAGGNVALLFVPVLAFMFWDVVVWG